MTVLEKITSAPQFRGDAGTIALLWVIPAAAYYALLLTAGTGDLLAPVPNGLTFNSMLLHLLHGRFDVDPAAIGAEGYLRDGAVYAYFGILPALARSVVVWLPNFATTDLTRVCCMIAATSMAFFKVLSLRLIWQCAGKPSRSTILVLLVAAILVSGPQIQFLRPSIYQEVELWSGALAAAYVYLFLVGLTHANGFSPHVLGQMAAVAGLCLLTRVSMALGLYVATGFIWIYLAWRQSKTGSDRLLISRLLPLIPSFVILTSFVAVTAVINQERWANPLVFADFTRALILEQYPERLARLQQYGEFNPARFGYGLGYYFIPLWAFRDSAGQLIWSHFEAGFTNCCVELPPSSFLISDPLLVGLAAYGVIHAAREQISQRPLIAAAAGGLLVPILLMLTAFSMTFRYRMEFYPFFELFAFLGFAALLAAPSRRATALVAKASIIGIVTAHGWWLLYMLSPFGPAGSRLGSFTVDAFYRSLF